MLCQLFIMGKFILVLYKEIKEYGIFGMQLFSHNDVSNDYNGLSDQLRCYDGNTGSPQCSTHALEFFFPNPYHGNSMDYRWKTMETQFSY